MLANQRLCIGGEIRRSMPFGKELWKYMMVSFRREARELDFTIVHLSSPVRSMAACAAGLLMTSAPRTACYPVGRLPGNLHISFSDLSDQYPTAFKHSLEYFDKPSNTQDLQQ